MEFTYNLNITLTEDEMNDLFGAVRSFTKEFHDVKPLYDKMKEKMNDCIEKSQEYRNKHHEKEAKKQFGTEKKISSEYIMITKEVLNSHPVSNLKKEISKTNIKGYSKMKKAEVISLMLKNKEKFQHIKKLVPPVPEPRKKKPVPQPRKKKIVPKAKPKITINIKTLITPKQLKEIVNQGVKYYTGSDPDIIDQFIESKGLTRNSSKLELFEEAIDGKGDIKELLEQKRKYNKLVGDEKEAVLEEIYNKMFIPLVNKMMPKLKSR